jgi:hypothetical protein
MVRAQRLYEAAAREYRSRGEEVVLTVSPQGVESVTPSPGYGVSGMVVAGPARRISPTSWIGTALERKGRVDLELRRELTGNTLGFEEVWSVAFLVCRATPSVVSASPNRSPA